MSARAKILEPTAENLSRAAEALKRGEVVAMPTETVYGLAGSALMPDALARIFETKERPTFDPLIVHVSLTAKGLWPLSRLGLIDLTQMSELARDRADKLISGFWPGPLTLVLPKNKDNVPDLATSGLATVGIRMPSHPVAQALLAAASMPLAAPSANRFGRISPTSAKDVLTELGSRIDFIVDGGRCEVGIESTIIGVANDGELSLLRPGGLAIEEIEKVAGAKLKLTSRDALAAEEHSAPQAPGMLESHYAPEKRFQILDGPIADYDHFEQVRTGSKLGLLVFSGSAEKARAKLSALTGCEVIARVLSERGDLREAAQKLFASIRELDESDASVLFAEPSPSREGLGFAIEDRLRRAGAGSRSPA